MNEIIRIDNKVDVLNDTLISKSKDISDLHLFNSKLNTEIRELIDGKQLLISENLKHQKHVQELGNHSQNLESQIKILKSKEDYLRNETKKIFSEKASLINQIFELDKLK